MPNGAILSMDIETIDYKSIYPQTVLTWVYDEIGGKSKKKKKVFIFR